MPTRRVSRVLLVLVAVTLAGLATGCDSAGISGKGSGGGGKAASAGGAGGSAVGGRGGSGESFGGQGGASAVGAGGGAAASGGSPGSAGAQGGGRGGAGGSGDTGGNGALGGRAGSGDAGGRTGAGGKGDAGRSGASGGIGGNGRNDGNGGTAGLAGRGGAAGQGGGIGAGAAGGSSPCASGNLCAQWKFEKASGFVDSVGNFGGGPWGSTATFVADRNGTPDGALHLDGSTQYASARATRGSGPLLNGGITVTAWVRHNSATYGEVFEAGSGAATRAFGLSFGSDPGKLEAHALGAEALSATALPTGTWTFLAFTYDGTHLTLYVNGDLNTDTVVSPPSPASSNISIATIGAYVNVGDMYTAGFIDADIDEIRLYSVALTGPQIKSVMQE